MALPGHGGVALVTLPKKQSGVIWKRFGVVNRGWGSLPVEATIRETKWKTSIFPDKETGAYLLPLKAEVRRKEGVAAGDTISFFLGIRARR